MTKPVDPWRGHNEDVLFNEYGSMPFHYHPRRWPISFWVLVAFAVAVVAGSLVGFIYP